MRVEQVESAAASAALLLSQLDDTMCAYGLLTTTPLLLLSASGSSRVRAESRESMDGDTSTPRAASSLRTLAERRQTQRASHISSSCSLH
jgi:hypothetical protein